MLYLMETRMRPFIPFVAGLAAYAAVLVVSQSLLAGGVEAPPARILLALAPMLPAAFVCATVITGIRHMDEMQRKVQVEALAMAFAGTALLTFGYGFLEGTGLPRLSMFAVWPLMAMLWFIGTLLGRWRLG